MKFFLAFLAGLMLLNAGSAAQDTVGVTEQGISDGVRNSKQQDRDEAIMDAKLKAIEKAGVNIESATTIENFQLKRDWIESKAKAFLLPGFQIIETGYGDDGLYHVVLVGKVAVSPDQKETEFVLVRGGTFEMGDAFGGGKPDERPAHAVTVSDFYLAKTEVTVAQYRVFCTETGRPVPPAPPWGFKDDAPVLNVTWNDAMAYCDWAKCRLPTEAEWEYAAREGGKKVRFGNGKDMADPAEINFNGSAPVRTDYSKVGVYRQRTTAVASYGPNALGLYDMCGNVWEWCSDWYGETYYEISPGLDPQGPDSGTERVLRGGCWSDGPWECRATNRHRLGPDGWISIGLGFRCAKGVNP